MAKFFILYTKKKSGSVADFYVEFLVSQLQIGDKFITYDTHHRIEWKVESIKAVEDKFILECSTPYGLGFDDQFSSAIVNTEGMYRTELFSYGDKRGEDLLNPDSLLSKQMRRIKR